MALDPLRFAIEIQDKATETLEGVKALLDKLRDTTINIQGGGDLKAIAASLEKIGGVSSGMSNNVEEATAALKREEEALLKLKDAATAAYWETDRLERARNVASSDVNREREKLEVLRNSGDAAKKAADGFKEYSEYAKKAGEELSKIKTYSLNPIKSIEDSTKKSFAELRDYYRRMLYSFANSAGSSFLGDKDLLANAKANIAKYREELVRLRDESKSLFASSGDKDVATMTRSLERMISEYDKVIGKYDEMRTKAQEGVKYHDLDGQIKRQQETLQKRLQEETVANDQLTQQRQRQSQINQQIAQQEQKVAEAKERLAQATQKQQQGDQQTAQTLQKEGQSATETAGSLSKLLAEKKAVTDAENKLAQANARNIQSFTAEGGASQTAARQMSQLVALLNQISQITPPDLGKLAQSLSGISGVKINDASFVAMGNALGEAAAKIEAAKQSINGGRFGELANRIKEATASLILFTAAFEKFNMTVGKDQGLKDFMTGLGEVIRNVRTQLNSLEKASGGSAVMTDLRKSVERAKYEYYQLENLIKRANAAVNEGKQYGNTSAIEKQIASVKEYIGTLEQLKKSGFANGMTTSDFKLQGQYRIDVDTLKKMVAELERSNAENQKLKTTTSAAAQSVGQLTAEEQRLAQALNQTTEHARGQSQVLSDLKSMAMQYLGVWGGQQFLRNIIEIGGQLEMQRLSIGAILQNQSQANDLFERIKGLAVQSPFGVVELDQMTKQLTAYGFKYNELFDMTKRLADISAATGTGVDRLALALGHVRSEAALSGYTLRQFSMANVPLLQKLSEKLGKTTQEIRKMVRAKEVSYEDVIGVLKDITNEGGMFYNMQEVISESVKAKFKNVKDAMDIMYGEMAEGYIGDSLKGVAEALMEVTRNWKDAATVLGTGAALWAAQRAAVMLHTAAIGKNNAAVLSSIASYKAQQAQALKLAWVYRERTAAEMQAISTSQRITAMERLRALTTGRVSKAQLERMAVARQDIIIGNALALSQGKLTAEDIAKQVATAKLTKTEARRIIILSDLSAAEKTAALNAVAGVRTYGRFTGVINGAALAAQRLGLALKSLIFNPAMLGMAAIAGIVELWQRNNAEMERAKELGDAIFEASQEGLKNARQMMQNTGIEAYQSRDGKLVNLTNSFGAENESVSKTFLIKPEFDPSTAQQIIEEWSQYIREYSGTPNKMLNDALLDESGNVRMLKDQFDQLYLSVEQVIKSQKGLASIADIFQMAQEDTGSGWLNEDIVEDIKDYDKALKSFNKTIITTFRNNGRAVKAGIDSARQFDANFAKNTEGMTSYGEMLKELAENYEKYGEAVRRFNDADYGNQNLIEDIIGDRGKMRGAREEMLNELNTFISGIQSAVEAGEIVLDDSTKNGLMAMFESKFIGSLGNISDEAKKELRKKFADAIGAVVDDAEETTEKRLADWQIRAGKVFEINKEIKVKTKTITDISEFAKAVQEDLKKKQDYIKNNASHINHVLNLKTSLKLDVNSLNDQIIALSAQVQKLVAQGKLEAAKSLNSIIQDELLPYRDAMMAVEENKKWLKSEGYPETEAAKDKSKNKKTGGTKTYKDEVAAEWRERIKLLKDANSLYKEWNKRSGEDAALSRVRQQYGDIFEKWRTDKNLPWKDFKAEDIIEYRSYIQKIVDEAQTRYNNQRNDKAKNYGKEAEAVLREGKKLLDDIDKYDFDEKAKDFTAAATKTIDQLSKRWEIFKSAVDTTGDALLAAQLAGLGDTDQGARTAAEAMRNELINQLNKLGGADLVAKIPLNIDLNEEEVRDKFLGAIPNADKVEDYKRSIDALIKLYQEWQKLQQKANTDDINTYTKIIGLANSYDAQVKKINKDLQEQLASISANPLLSESQKSKGLRMAQASADWKKMKLSADYANLHNRAVAMSAEEYERAEIAIRNMIERLRALDLLSPEEYISETNALNKAAKERRQDTNGALGHFITGGQQGLRDYYQRIADAALENRSRYTAGSAEWKKADAEYKKNKEKADAIDDEIAGIQATQAALENLQKAASLLSDFFTAIAGESGEGAALGSISGGAMSGASALSGFGPWGMAAGAILGGATAMIQEGDKAAERAIQELRGDVQAIESNTEEILRLRERTLGYDSGKYLADLYKNQAALVSEYFANPFDSKEAEKSFHASWGASIMSDWYKELYGGASSGYEAQYNNLIEQRKNYLAILDEQNEKKHKSDEEIAETKSKIAELDDQIMNFSQDLAKELWGIDIKGWADQLSDALASAFENGENMAKAYRDTVTSILQQMMQKMMKMQILEPMFANLQKDLFGENGKGGVFDPNNPKGSMSKVTKIIGDYFGKGGEGEKAITASMEFMTAFERAMQNAGLTVLNEASNTLSSGIQGTSEETSDLLAGYVNALRQDVSVNRILLTQYVTQLWPQYIEAYTAQVTSVSNIDNNVRIIMEMMQLGNGAMYERISNISSRIDNIVMGIDSISIR